MHVIDFIRDTRRKVDDGVTGGESVIELPPFHRGHLGFLPGTGVHLGIHGEGHLYEKGCELIISAYPSVTANLAELSCTMEDSVGVVNKLLRALKSLNVNILIAETYSIKHNKRHHMELVFDWSTSPLARPQPVPVAFRSTIERLHTLVPGNDFRYLRLLARILQCCAEDLVWDEHTLSGLQLPQLRLRPFELRSTFAGTGRSSVSKVSLNSVATEKDNKTKKGKKTGQKVVIGLSDIEHDLRRILNLSSEPGSKQSDHDPLPYLMLSDTSTRSLRVWFPQNNDIARQILHLGFAHSDISGALETITKILKFSGFNLLTSLLRRGRPGQNVWEVHLQYENKDEELQTKLSITDRTQRLEEIINWLCSKIDLNHVESAWRNEIGRPESKALDLRSDLRNFKVHVRAPEYPQLKDGVSLERPFLWQDDNVVDAEEKTAGTIPDEDDIGVAERRHWTEIALRDKGALRQARCEWAQALAVADGVPVPRLFLSYPHTAKSHAVLLKDAIHQEINSGQARVPYIRLLVDEFQDQNLLDISGTVLAMIRRADFFLGIWHSEEDRKDTISPWMPYEYGVAKAMGKPTAVIVEDSIPKTVWGRIDPHISRPLYNDLSFQTMTVNQVIDYIEHEWLAQIPEKDRVKGAERLWGESMPEYA